MTTNREGATTAGVLSMGLDTYQVSLDGVFGSNRRKLVDALATQAAAASDGNQHCCIFLSGGASETRYDSDHEPLFRQESYFAWLSGVKEPDCALLIEICRTATTTLFIPRLPPSYATFMGHLKTPEEWKTSYQVDNVRFIEESGAELSKFDRILLLEGTNSDSGKAYQPAKLPSAELEAKADTTTLFPVLAECRVLKSEAERLLMQYVTELTSWAHAYVMRNCRSGMMEYQLESLFRHYCYYNYGCRLTGYTPVCGCGPNGAILHYGHAGEPNARQLQIEGDMCLMDMGAEYCFYGSDVTCSYPANGKFTPKQAGIYDAVLDAQRAVFSMVKPGVSWVDCHKTAERTILQSLVKIGIVVLNEQDDDDASSRLDELVEKRLGAVFMPHGLGHFIGVDTHDVGGYLDGHPARIPEPGLKSLRTARILEQNMCLTNEPGCYFIDHLLDEALNNPKLCPYLNADLINAEYRGFGGVRIEDVFCVTADGFVNYTLCPRTVAEVESVMAGNKWPPLKDEAPELGRVRLLDPTPLPPPPSL